MSHSSRQELSIAVKHRAGDDMCSLPMQLFYAEAIVVIMLYRPHSAVTMSVFKGHLWTSDYRVGGENRLPSCGWPILPSSYILRRFFKMPSKDIRFRNPQHHVHSLC